MQPNQNFYGYYVKAFFNILFRASKNRKSISDRPYDREINFIFINKEALIVVQLQKLNYFAINKIFK